MTPSIRLGVLFLLTAFGAPAFAKGKPATAGGGGAAAVSTQKAILARIKEDQQKIVQYGKDLVAAAQAVLNLDAVKLDQLEKDLEAAFDLAKDQFEALPAADQTEANLKPLIYTEINKVWPLYTADAGQLAALGTAAQAFADAVGPLEIEKRKLRADIKALPKGKGKSKP